MGWIAWYEVGYSKKKWWIVVEEKISSETKKAN